jgi:hypothetical protein
MYLLDRFEPKYNTLMQACLIVILLVLISFAYDSEEKASAQVQAVAAMRY